MCENENKVLETLNNFLYINLMTYANSHQSFFNMVKLEIVKKNQLHVVLLLQLL